MDVVVCLALDFLKKNIGCIGLFIFKLRDDFITLKANYIDELSPFLIHGLKGQHFQSDCIKQQVCAKVFEKNM